MKKRKTNNKHANPNINIPFELTSFVGRERELLEIKKLLSSNRLVTITGTGGCGKTRMAVRLASAICEDYVDGLYWIGLASLADNNLLAQTITKVLQIPQDSRRSSEDVLIDALKNKQFLLILDNCEHLLDTCTNLVTLLLAKTEVSILTTSREVLQTRGEAVYPLHPMALPLDDSHDIDQFDAVKLFIERAKSIVPAFELSESNAKQIARICQQLDGIPLAIELASAHTKILSVEQISDRLDQRFQLLPNDSHLTSSPHIGLRAAIDWSYDLLSAKEQLLFQRLSVFQGGCTLSIVEKICTGDGIEEIEVLDLMSSLVNKSLVVAQTLQRGEARYVFLETIRQYAQEKLIASGESSTLRDKHLQCFLELTEQTEPKLKGKYQELWLNWLEREYNNVRHALSWAMEDNNIEAGLRISNALYLFWIVRNYAAEGLFWLEQFLALENDDVAPVIRANAFAFASFLSGFQGKLTAQTAYGREAIDRAEALGDEGQNALAWTRAGDAYAHGRPGPLPSGGSVLAWILVAQAYGARAVGDYETELITYKKIIQMQRESDDDYNLGMSLITCSFAAMSLGKYEEARVMVDEGLPLLRKTENLYSIAMSLNGSGDLARCQQNYTLAQAHYEESIMLLRELGATRDLASSLHNLGHTYVHLDDIEHAYTLLSESMTLQQDQNNKPGIGECLIGFAAIAAVSDMPAQSTRLLTSAVAIGGEEITTTWPATRMEYNHYLAHVRNRLNEMDFHKEQAAGGIIAVEQAVAYALDVARKAVRTQRSTRLIGELTPRELEVATLIGQAMSNKEISNELVLSKRTVESHIANIRSKLQFTKRAQIVQWAIENEFVRGSD